MTTQKHEEKSYFKQAFRLTIGIGFVIGLAVLLLAGYITDPATKEITRQVGIFAVGAFGASLLNEFILGEYTQHQSRDVIKEAVDPGLKDIKDTLSKMIEPIAPSVQENTTNALTQLSDRIQSETNLTLGEMKDKILTATDIMTHQIDVLSGAKAAGIVNIFPRRYKTIPGDSTKGSDAWRYPSVMDVIANDIAAETSFIYLMGISLGDYFLDRGSLHEPLIKILESPKAPNIQALIVHPKSRALGERARWEAKAKNNNDFFVSTTFIETDGSARISKKLCQEYKNLDVRLYDQAPTAFVLLTTRFAFFEPYTYAARGSNVPTFQVQANTALYNNYKKHFENIWEVATLITQYDPLKEAKGPFEL